MIVEYLIIQFRDLETGNCLQSQYESDVYLQKET